jgi:hypothetical protein
VSGFREKHVLEAVSAEFTGIGTATAIWGAMWQILRLPALMFLVVLEPIISLACFGLALLGVLTTIFFILVGPANFPWITMLCLSAGFAVAAIAYSAIIRLLSM